MHEMRVSGLPVHISHDRGHGSSLSRCPILSGSYHIGGDGTIQGGGGRRGDGNW